MNAGDATADRDSRLAALRVALRDPAWCSATVLAARRVGDLTPGLSCQPTEVADLAATLAAAHAQRLACLPVGSGTQLAVGNRLRAYDLAVATCGLTRVVEHAAADLTVTVQAGMTLAELNRRLADAGQHLALDPPHPESATLGAIVATDACGPWRYSQGKVRDLLIGITVVLADGTVVKGGGRVVKNVAGYDLMKIFTGSFGTLGVIAEMSFKLRPRPAREALVARACGGIEDAIATCLGWRDAAIEPWALEALDEAAAATCGFAGPTALVQVAGSEREVAAQLDELRRRDPGCRLIDSGEMKLRRLRDFRCGGEDRQWVARLSAAPNRLAAALATASELAAEHGIAGATCAHAGNGTAWLRLEVDDAERGEQFVTQVRRQLGDGAWLVVSRMPEVSKERLDAWGPMPAPALQRSVRRALDPDGRLSPGRLGE